MSYFLMSETCLESAVPDIYLALQSWFYGYKTFLRVLDTTELYFFYFAHPFVY